MITHCDLCNTMHPEPSCENHLHEAVSEELKRGMAWYTRKFIEESRVTYDRDLLLFKEWKSKLLLQLTMKKIDCNGYYSPDGFTICMDLIKEFEP